MLRWNLLRPRFGGEDLVNGNPWYHEQLTRLAARGIGGWGERAAASLAWHADAVDSYAYNPLWWARGGEPRFKASLRDAVDLERLHFDDMTSTRQIQLVWSRYLAGMVAGLLWAAERGDVAAARNIAGAGLHALQDFYSHSNWVDAPERRLRTWPELGIRLAGAPDPRDALHLYSGAYEVDPAHAFKPHGKFALDCTLLKTLPGAFMDMACSPFSPFGNTELCGRWRNCKGAATPRPETVAGVPIPPGILYVEPPGIALDNRWLAKIAYTQRDIPDRQAIDADGLFDRAYDLALIHSMSWLEDLDTMIALAGHGAFWSRVKTEPDDAAADIAQYEDGWRIPFTFMSAGRYPPDPAGADEGWYLRLQIRTADEIFAGTNADIYASVDGRGFLLDYMHDRVPDGGVGQNRLLEYNDFEQGDDDTYVIGPFAERPRQLILRNSAPNCFDIAAAAWHDFRDFVEGVLEDIGDGLLSLVAGHADRVGSAQRSWSWADLTAISDSRSWQPLPAMTVEGGAEGSYTLGGVVAAWPEADAFRAGIALTELTCVRESENDRFSPSDEPFVLVQANSPANRDVRSATIGPLADVDSGDRQALGQPGAGTWWIGTGGPLQWVAAGDTAPFGDLTRAAIRFFTGDFDGDGRTDVLFYCADDGNWWLGASTGGRIGWRPMGNTAGFGDLTRAAIRFFTGDFTGDGRTDVLFYCANDGAWWLGTSTGDQLSWRQVCNTAGFGDLTRGAIRMFAGDFTGDGRTDVLFYCGNDGAWWLGAWDASGQLSWRQVANNRPLGDLSGASTVMRAGNFTGDGRAVVLFCAGAQRNWWMGRFDGAQLGLTVVGATPQFGNLGRAAIRFFDGDFEGDGRAELLFYCAEDGNWWRGDLETPPPEAAQCVSLRARATGLASDIRSMQNERQWLDPVTDKAYITRLNQQIAAATNELMRVEMQMAEFECGAAPTASGFELMWRSAGNTTRFGDLNRPAIRFFEGDFGGDGRTDVLFYCADDGNWWLGAGGNSQLAWTLIGNTAALGDLRRPSVRLFSGAFGGGTRTRLLLHVPMLVVTVPRYGGLIAPVQVWEHDDESQADRDRLERSFRDGFDSRTTDRRSELLDAIGAAIAPDWKVASVDAFAFRRGTVAEVAHLVRDRVLDEWVQADTSVIVPFDPVLTTQVPIVTTFRPVKPDEPVVPALIAAIDRAGRPLEGQRLYAKGVMMGGYSVRLEVAPRGAPVTVTLTASQGVTLDRSALAIAPGQTAGAFAASLAAGSSGPRWIKAAIAGATFTASFTAVAFTRIELADGRPLPATVAPGQTLSLRVKLSGPPDYNDAVQLTADAGLAVSPPSVAMMAGATASRPFSVTVAADALGTLTLRASNGNMRKEAAISVVGAPVAMA